MLRQTTQLGRYFADASWSRIFPINNRATQTTICGFSVLYRYSSCDGKSQEYSLLHLSSGYIPDVGIVYVHTMKSITQRNYKQSLRAFCKEVVVLHTLVCDPLRSQRGEEVRRLIRGRHNTMYDCLNEALNGQILQCISWD
eukprot:scaffold13100_cov84-Skeletonema_dohrnii-CCMP3373.AAC.1